MQARNGHRRYEDLVDHVDHSSESEQVGGNHVDVLVQDDTGAVKRNVDGGSLDGREISILKLERRSNSGYDVVEKDPGKLGNIFGGGQAGKLLLGQAPCESFVGGSEDGEASSDAVEGVHQIGELDGSQEGREVLVVNDGSSDGFGGSRVEDCVQDVHDSVGGTQVGLDNLGAIAAAEGNTIDGIDEGIKKAVGVVGDADQGSILEVRRNNFGCGTVSRQVSQGHLPRRTWVSRAGTEGTFLMPALSGARTVS